MCNHTVKGICFILPPHILEHVIRNSKDANSRGRAAYNLQIQSRLHGMRAAFAQFSFAGLGTGTKRRTIYDAGRDTQLPGRLVRSEDQGPIEDVAANEAYDFSGQTYDFYLSTFRRNSVDDHGMRLDSSVHYAQDFDNALWNGQQMVYGDGDGRIFGSFTKCIEIVGHELTHGVTQFTAGLEYQDQSGALNESMSDVFGIMLKQYQNKQKATPDASWLIGEGLFVPASGSNRTALRSMKAPGTAYDDPEIGKDPQPGHMDDYVQGSFDNGGVHINSGIPNRAFYLAATKLGGFAWDVAGQIWYEVLTTRLQANSQFADAASAARDIASKYGKEATQAVDEAWKEVGL